MQLVITRSRCCVAALIAAFVVTGCSSENWNWDWDWLHGGRKKEQQKPVTKARRPTDQPATAQASPKETETSDDPRARDVDAKVQLYVRSMTPVEDAAYVPNDFNAKMQRQQDPKRRNRIRKVAERTRAQPPDAYGDPSYEIARRSDSAAPNQPGISTEDAIVPPASVEPQALTGDTTSMQPKDEGRVAAPGLESTPAEVESVPPESGANDDVADEARVTPNTAATTATIVPGEPSEASTPSEAPTRPPVLEQIKVSAGPEPPAGMESDTAAGLTTANEAKAAVEPVDTFKQRLDELESQVEKEPNNLDAQYNLRMMYLVGGQEDEALAPIDGTDAEIQEMIQAHFRALIAAQSSPGRDAAISANHQLVKIEELRNVIRARADLDVSKVVLCTAIQGFGRYTPVESTEYKAGRKNQILAYAEVDNFRSEKTPSGMYRTLLSVRQSLLTKSGEELWSTHDANIEDLARERRQDFFLSLGPWTIPKTVGPGEYVLKVEVEDILGGKINSNVAKFKMVP